FSSLELFERLAVIVETFRIVRSPVDKLCQRLLRIRAHRRCQVSRADLAPDLAVRVLVVLFEHDAEIIDGVLQPALFAGDPAQLEMRVCFVVRDLNGLLETRNRLRVLVPVLVDQTELIMSTGVARVDRRRFHRTTKSLALSQREADVADVAAKHTESVEKQERREKERRDTRK